MQTITFNKIALGFFAVLLALGFYVSAAESTYAATSDRTSSSTPKTRVKVEGNTRATSSVSTTTDRTRTESDPTGISSTINTSCMVSAVTKREAALGDAWGDLSDSLTGALTKRAEDLVAAWSKTDSKARQTANKSAWAAWKESKASAQKTFKDTRKEVWTSFKSNVKSECKVTLPKEEALEKSSPDSIAL